MARLEVTTHVNGLDKDALSGKAVYEGDAAILRDIDVPSGETRCVELTFRQTDLGKGTLIFEANAAVSIGANDQVSPTDAFEVSSGQVVQVTRLNDDVDALYLRNGGEQTATVRIRGVRTSVV